MKHHSQIFWHVLNLCRHHRYRMLQWQRGCRQMTETQTSHSYHQTPPHQYLPQVGSTKKCYTHTHEHGLNLHHSHHHSKIPLLPHDCQKMIETQTSHSNRPPPRHELQTQPGSTSHCPRMHWSHIQTHEHSLMHHHYHHHVHGKLRTA